jgi:hypothetical protein
MMVRAIEESTSNLTFSSITILFLLFGIYGFFVRMLSLNYKGAPQSIPVIIYISVKKATTGFLASIKGLKDLVPK